MKCETVCAECDVRDVKCNSRHIIHHIFYHHTIDVAIVIIIIIMIIITITTNRTTTTLVSTPAKTHGKLQAAVELVHHKLQEAATSVHLHYTVLVLLNSYMNRQITMIGEGVTAAAHDL